MPDPLRRSNRRRSAARLAYSNAPAARAMRDIAFLSKRKAPPVHTIARKIGDLLGIATKAGKPLLAAKLRKAMNELRGNITKRAARQILLDVLQTAGPAGQIIADTLPEGKKVNLLPDQLGVAERLVMGITGEITPEEAGGRRVEEPQVSTPQRFSGPPMPANTTLLPSGRAINIKTHGFNRSYDLTDPTITGEMIPVTSSNVHSIGFKFNYKNPVNSTLLVRYLDNKNGVRTGGGPTYEYFDIHPDKFQQFRKAASQGVWVWDELRVRGSRVEHQVRYNLARIVRDYLPRQAVVRNGREMWVRRTRQTRAKFGEQPRTITSPLPDRDLGPARGRPNRGRPNRGRP